jgi:Fic-DOC domain mobile mystery protein B
MFEHEPDNATPIDPDEAADLIPGHIHTRNELNRWEQKNILEAAQWAEITRKDALEESFLRDLHRRMFDRTWRWAGRYRLSNKNIGVDWPHIASEVRVLIDDGRYWLENQVFSIDEAALRLHHRLVRVHAFPNGNGRHGRLWCDVVLRQHGRPTFDWKPPDLDHPGAARKAYIAALREADQNDYRGLIDLILMNRG